MNPVATELCDQQHQEELCCQWPVSRPETRAKTFAQPAGYTDQQRDESGLQQRYDNTVVDENMRDVGENITVTVIPVATIRQQALEDSDPYEAEDKHR